MVTNADGLYMQLQAGIASPDNPSQLLIALEPEAASIYVRKLRLYQLVPEPPYISPPRREPTPDLSASLDRFSDDEFPAGRLSDVCCLCF